MRMTKDQYQFFIDSANEIINNSEYQKLKQYIHHSSLTRYEHCYDVAFYAYYSALKKKRREVDLKIIIRAALLHDFFLYCRKEEIVKKHLRNHPVVAYKNSKKLFEVSDKEKNIILSHMWPIGGEYPKYLESRIVNCADKKCSLMETFKVQKKLKKGILLEYSKI